MFQSKQTMNKAPVPVICVGNITAGGSGKTPVCIAISEYVKIKYPHKKLAFLTRGYGGNQDAPRTIEGNEPASEVGDEPLILAKHAKTVVSPKRHKGACTAYEQGAQLIIMDDGLLNNTIQKDLSFMVIDGKTGIGNGKTIPAGPLREPFDSGLRRSDAVIIIGKDEHNLKQKIPHNKPVIYASVIADLSRHDTNQTYVAFCGIALPYKFERTLTENKFKIEKLFEFSDHYNYTPNDLAKIKEFAKSKNAKIITTEKDYMRLSTQDKEGIAYLPIKIQFEDITHLDTLISGVLT